MEFILNGKIKYCFRKYSRYNENIILYKAVQISEIINKKVFQTMRFTALFAIAVAVAGVEAVELHAHANQKSASGAHARRVKVPKALAQKPKGKALAQQKAKAGAHNKKFNMDKLKEKANTAKSWAAERGDELRADYDNARNAYAEGGWEGALNSAQESANELRGDAQNAE